MNWIWVVIDFPTVLTHNPKRGFSGDKVLLISPANLIHLHSTPRNYTHSDALPNNYDCSAGLSIHVIFFNYAWRSNHEYLALSLKKEQHIPKHAVLNMHNC